MPTVPGLQPLRDAALPLIATLLTLTIETSTAEFDSGAFDAEASAAFSFLPVTAGQSLPELASYGEGEETAASRSRTSPKSPISPPRRNPRRPGSRSSWDWTRPWTNFAAIPSTSSSAETRPCRIRYSRRTLRASR